MVPVATSDLGLGGASYPGFSQRQIGTARLTFCGFLSAGDMFLYESLERGHTQPRSWGITPGGPQRDSLAPM